MISVVIPSFNSSKTIEHTLKSLFSQNRADLLSEIIVVDSSDDNKTKQILSKYQSEKILIISEGVKTIPAIARNLGVKYAKADILAFIDADAFAACDWLEKINLASKSGIRMGGGTICLPEFQRNRILPLAQYFLQFNEFIGNKSHRDKKFVPSVNMFCERKLFDEVGGFPDIRASEDVLFGLKVNRITPICFVPSVRVYHIFRQDWAPFLDNEKLLGKYIIKYRKQTYRNKFYYRGLWPVFLFPVFILIKFLRMLLRIIINQPCLLIKFVYVLPVFMVGLLYWGIGFLDGCLKDK